LWMCLNALVRSSRDPIRGFSLNDIPIEILQKKADSSSLLNVTIWFDSIAYLGRTVVLNNLPEMSPMKSDNSSATIGTKENTDVSGTSMFVCIPKQGYQAFFGTYIPIFDILLVAAIPFFLLCFTNIGIIVYTMRANRTMRQHRKRAHRRHQRLTIMLLSVTLAFIGLTCPSVIFICVNKVIYNWIILSKQSSNSLPFIRVDVSQPASIQFAVDICEALWFTKHAMNFVLYTLSGQDFRREFGKLFTIPFRQNTLVSTKSNQTNITTYDQTAESSLTERSVMLGIKNRKKFKKSMAVPTNTVSEPSVVALINSKSTSAMIPVE
jgi:hypothetical protein